MKTIWFMLYLFTGLVLLTQNVEAADRGFSGSPDFTRTSGNCNQLEGYDDTNLSDGRTFGSGGSRSRLCRRQNVGRNCRTYSVASANACRPGDRYLGATGRTIGGEEPTHACASSGCSVNDRQNETQSPSQAPRSRGRAS